MIPEASAFRRLLPVQGFASSRAEEALEDFSDSVADTKRELPALSVSLITTRVKYQQPLRNIERIRFEPHSYQFTIALYSKMFWIANDKQTQNRKI